MGLNHVLFRGSRGLAGFAGSQGHHEGLAHSWLRSLGHRVEYLERALAGGRTRPGDLCALAREVDTALLAAKIHCGYGSVDLPPHLVRRADVVLTKVWRALDALTPGGR